MIKDYFVDVFLQVSIILSLLKSDYRDLSLHNQLNTLHVDFNGELIVSSIIDFHNINGRNIDQGHIHPKNARIEDVLRSIHSLGHYEYFRGISSDIVNAFLVDESSGVGHSSASGNGATSRSSCSSENGLSCASSAAGDEPTKEDMDLIDVLWRYDIDLDVDVDCPHMLELEKELEVHLHGDLEEEAIASVTKRENQALNFDNPQESTRDYGELPPRELNTPDVLTNSSFLFFNEEESIESNWTSLMNLFGVENNTSSDVEGEMFSNLFDLHDNERVKEEMPPQDDNPALLSPSGDADFSIYNDSVLERSMGLFEDLGMDLDFDELTELRYCDDNGTSSSVTIGLTGRHTPGSATASSLDHPFYDLLTNDESAFTPGKHSDRISSRCSFSSDSLLASCTGPSIWASTRDVNHNHTYNTKLLHEPCEDKDERFKQKTRSVRSRDEIKLKQMDIPFALKDVINNPIEWFMNVTTSPKYSLTQEQVELLKSIRKRGKNKEAAHNCRKRKLDEIQSLEIDVESLTNKKNELEKNCYSLETSVDKLTRKFAELQEKILSSVRDRQKFESANVSLQFDGSGILRVTEGPQKDKWNSAASDNSSRNLSKSKRRQQKRN